jgi:hypothetical protein
MPRFDEQDVKEAVYHCDSAHVPCITEGKDATCELTTYGQVSTSIVIDLQTIGCVVGRVKRGKTWGIVDRSGELARTVFVD